MNTSRKPELFEELVNEVRLLWHCLVNLSDELHAEESITAGMRAVLEYLLIHGPAPVPSMALERNVTRQHIQSLVNALLERELVKVQDNPAHKRSVLVALTPPGKAVIKRMKQRESELVAGRDLGMGADELLRVTRALRLARRALTTRDATPNSSDAKAPPSLEGATAARVRRSSKVRGR